MNDRQRKAVFVLVLCAVIIVVFVTSGCRSRTEFRPATFIYLETGGTINISPSINLDKDITPTVKMQ